MSILPQLAPIDRLRLLPPRERAALYGELAATPGALSDVDGDWDHVWARQEQLFTVEDLERHSLIVICGARREGKTRSAVQLYIREVDEGRAVRPRIFAATEADVDKSLVHGVSGIITCLSSEQRRRWRWIKDEGPAGVIRVRNRLGADVEVTGFTAKAPEGAVSHAGDLDLYDDVAKWGPHALIAWTHARISCSEGYACGIVATTPRGTALLRKLLAGDVEGVLVRNLRIGGNVLNLAAKWRANLKAELGEVAGDLLRQELDGEDMSAASPFGGIDFGAAPVRVLEVRREDLDELVVAVDPAEGKGGDHDLWGIGAAGRRRDRHIIVVEDRSGSYDDAEAGEAVLELCERRGASKIIVETNRGPRVLSALRAAHLARELAALRADPTARPHAMPELVPVTAKEGKRLRAGPVRTLYLDGLLHHGPGLAALERQQREWDPEAPRRPRVDDRIDWLVHAVQHLALGDDKQLAAREAFKGFAEAQTRMPARAFGGARGDRDRGDRLA